MSFNATLEEISKKMGMGRPKTERLINLDCPPYGLVLKREFSDTGRDVHVPKLQDTTERGRATTVKSRRVRQEEKQVGAGRRMSLAYPTASTGSLDCRGATDVCGR